VRGFAAAFVRPQMVANIASWRLQSQRQGAQSGINSRSVYDESG